MFQNTAETLQDFQISLSFLEIRSCLCKPHMHLWFIFWSRTWISWANCWFSLYEGSKSTLGNDAKPFYGGVLHLVHVPLRAVFAVLHYKVNLDFYEYLILFNQYWHLHSILYKEIVCQGKWLSQLSGIACQINSTFLPVSFGKQIIDNAKQSKPLFLTECSVQWVWNSTEVQNIHSQTLNFIPSHFHSMTLYKLLSE